MKKALVVSILSVLLLSLMVSPIQAWRKTPKVNVEYQFSQGQEYRVHQIFLVLDNWRGMELYYIFLIEREPRSNNFETWMCNARKVAIHFVDTDSEFARLVPRFDLGYYYYLLKRLTVSDKEEVEKEIDVYLPKNFRIQRG